jgi:probable F420-dependent oxidoreductase
VQVGVFIFATDRSPPIDVVARAAEERGFDLLLVPEHTHIPAARTMLSPRGGELADEHRRSLDPFVALSVAAAVTDRLRVGTGICLVAQRDPIILAKEVASLDFVSNGRFVFGVGHGWHAEEVGNHGIDLRRRRAVAAEKVAALKAIWAHDVTAWDGEDVRFTALHSWPKPVQRPHPPILVGGSPNEAVLRDVVAYGDGWMPYAYFHEVAAGVERLRALADAAGRDVDSIELAVMGCSPRRAEIERFAEMGAARVVFDLPSEGHDELLTRLDRYAGLLEAVRP